MTPRQLSKLKNTLRPQVRQVVRKTLLKQDMSPRQLSRLRNTVMPQVRKAVKETILQQKRTVVGTQLQNKLIDVAYHRADSVVSGGRADAGEGSRRRFPSKNVLLKYKNRHTVDKFVQNAAERLYDYIRQNLNEDISQQPSTLFDAVQSRQFQNLQKTVQHSRYMNPQIRKTIKLLSELRWRVRDLKTKLEDFIQRTTKIDMDSTTVQQAVRSDKNVRRLYDQLLLKYQVERMISSLTSRVMDAMPIEDIQEENKSIDYRPVVFRHQMDQYPKRFVQQFKNDANGLQNFVQMHIEGTGADLGSIFADYWYQDKDRFVDSIHDKVGQILIKNGINDPEQAQRIFKIIFNKIKKEE